MRLLALLIVGLALSATAAPAQADTWTVTNGSSDAASPTCNPDLHICVSLRTALAASEATKGIADIINVPAGAININNDLEIQSDITVNGTSARSNIIDGGFKYRGFRVSSTGSAKINHFTIRNAAGGQGGTPDGGGILNASGVVQLTYVRVTASQPGTGGNGGGIANVQGTLTMAHSLIDNNTGGGVANLGGVESPDRGLFGAVDSTIFNNTAGIGTTGGIDSRGGTLNVVILNRSTVANNTGGVRAVGGLLIGSGTAQVVASLFARNTVSGASSNCGATKPLNSSSNVEDKNDCGFDLADVNPGLATSLSSAGGELDVLALTASSPAIDHAPLSACSAAGTSDQRDLPRPQGPGCDSGAYELDQAATMTITTGPSGTVDSGDVQFNFSSNEPGVAPVCQLAGPGQTLGYVPCYKSNAQPYGGLANGTYTFSVRDGAFPASTPATRTFTVAALDTLITTGADGPTNDTTPTYSFTGTLAASFQCRFDTGPFAACASPFTPTTALGQGAHTFEVRALNAAGAPDPTPASRSFTIDTTPPPPPTVQSGPEGATTDSAPAFAFSAPEAAVVMCKLDGPGAAAGTFGTCSSPKSFSALAPGDYVFSVRSVDAAGNEQTTQRAFTVTVPQQAKPTPTLTRPVAGQSVEMKPVGGKVLIRLPGSSKFVPLDPSVIKNGAEVDTRHGVVEITRSDGGTARFYDGIFKLSQSGGITTLTLTEKLTGCPSKKKASAAAKKPKTRKLWGDGKGKFRTRGQYSAATVRGTEWLVQDSCAGTLTRVRKGVVAVRDNVKRKTIVLRAGKSYTARPRR
jgi:hypothetical protein